MDTAPRAFCLDEGQKDDGTGMVRAQGPIATV